MTKEYAAAVEAPPRFRTRMNAGVRKPANWMELVRFSVVGASGYVVNLLVFTVLVHGVGTHYRVAATGAFLIAVANNFWWNRQWTFKAHHGRAAHQSAKFLTVSVAAFCLNLLVLEALVAGLGAPEVPAQAVAIAAATPISFLGNKLWSFAR
ncbi:MAG TPA: GtrA family protein [Solirubrobacteraceae bacterium]|nr:GtrA family protein [Solirubrobacteraceae bacterium]